jgi:hypothetical protein
MQVLTSISRQRKRIQSRRCKVGTSVCYFTFYIISLLDSDIGFSPLLFLLLAALDANQENVLAILIAAGVDLKPFRREVERALSLGSDAFLAKHPRWKPVCDSF